MSRKHSEPDPAGILLVDKPSTWTSHDVVAFVRRFGFRKVGHAGTLDPAATGLLVLLVGRQATRAASQLSGQDKTYVGTVTLGVETDSLDADGSVTKESPWEHLSPTDVEAALPAFRGDIEQIPPMVSAVKIKGKRLYKMAREGKTVERPPRPVTIHELTLLATDLPNFEIRVHCSKGTYVRTLAADIGTALGCGAHLSALRRFTSGCYSIDNAVTIDTLRTWDRQAVCDHLLPVPAAPEPTS
jgi:tRNA pseudouridine55 synthase